MKILTIGASPTLYTSCGRLHADIIRHLSQSNEVASAVYDHDVKYFLPEQTANGPAWFHEVDGRKIPLVPFLRNGGKYPASVYLFEVVKANKPDVILTIGPLEHFAFIPAIRSLLEGCGRWVAVCTNHPESICGEIRKMASEADSVLCTSRAAYEAMADVAGGGWHHVGTGLWLPEKAQSVSGRVVCIARNSFEECPIAVMDAFRMLSGSSTLYLHTNLNDRGYYDLASMRKDMDPLEEYIFLPSEFSSVIDGYRDDMLASEMSMCEVVVRAGASSGTAMSLFDAMACGCTPVVADHGCDSEVARDASAEGIECFLYPATAAWGQAGERIFFPRSSDIAVAVKKASEACRNNDWKAGQTAKISKFIEKRGRSGFLSRVVEMLHGPAGRQTLSLL